MLTRILILLTLFLVAGNHKSIAQKIWGPVSITDLPKSADISDYNTKVSINPENAKFYKQRADFLVKRQDYNRAITDYKKSIKLDSSLKNIYNNYGVALFKKEKYQKAIQQFNKGIEETPKQGHLYYNRGLTYFRVNKPKKGCSDLKTAYKTDNDYDPAKDAHKQYCR